MELDKVASQISHRTASKPISLQISSIKTLFVGLLSHQAHGVGPHWSGEVVSKAFGALQARNFGDRGTLVAVGTFKRLFCLFGTIYCAAL